MQFVIENLKNIFKIHFSLTEFEFRSNFRDIWNNNFEIEVRELGIETAWNT